MNSTTLHGLDFYSTSAQLGAMQKCLSHPDTVPKRHPLTVG